MGQRGGWVVLRPFPSLVFLYPSNTVYHFYFIFFICLFPLKRKLHGIRVFLLYLQHLAHSRCSISFRNHTLANNLHYFFKLSVVYVTPSSSAPPPTFAKLLIESVGHASMYNICFRLRRICFRLKNPKLSRTCLYLLNSSKSSNTHREAVVLRPGDQLFCSELGLPAALCAYQQLQTQTQLSSLMHSFPSSLPFQFTNKQMSEIKTITWVHQHKSHTVNWDSSLLSFVFHQKGLGCRDTCLVLFRNPDHWEDNEAEGKVNQMLS